MADSVISVRDVGKTFRIPLDKPSTLKHRIMHPRSTTRFRRFEALKAISFDVAPGEFLGVIGHNGSGKSTLLKILSGIYVADAGTVEIDGRVSPFLELGVGFNPELTARENVFLSGSVLGLTRRQLSSRVDDIIAFAEIGEFAETKLKNFSSGMQVRLAFSVAIQADAAILLMDEVLAVGDAAFAERCLEVFANYKRDGRTVVLVTHDLGAVQTYCDRCLLLDHGNLKADGSPSEVSALYRRSVGVHADDTSEHLDIPAEANRFGSREVAITSVRLLDEEGSQHTAFTTGRPMTLEIGYVVNDDSIGDFVCWLGVERGDGLRMAVTGTEPDGLAIAVPPPGETGTIRYVIDKLPLLGASYMFTVGLHQRSSGHALDHIQRAAGFQVIDERGQAGIIDLAGTWELSRGDREAASLPIAARRLG